MNIPFSAPLGPTNGRDNDGCLHSRLAYANPTAALTSTIAMPVGNVFRGNADAAGGITYEDITTPLSAASGTDATLFDDENPTMDELWIDVDQDDSIVGFGIYITTPGVYTGTAACEVRYKNTSGVWVTADCDISGQLDSVGMVYISFPVVLGSSLALQDALIDPVNNPQSRRFLIKFNGITAVTTAPVVDMLVKTVSTEQLIDLIDYIADDVDSIPAAYDALSLFTHAGDRSLFGFSERFSLLKITIKRERVTPDANLIYSKADGTFGVIQALKLNSADAGRSGQWLTVDPGASPVDYVDVFSPPSDWGKQTISVNGSSYRGYFIGLEYTAGSDAPELAMLISMKAGEFVGVDGVECKQQISNADVSVLVRNPSTSECVFAIANITTGTYGLLTLPADEYNATVGTSLSFAVGDKIAIQQISGDEVSVPSDGFFTIN